MLDWILGLNLLAYKARNSPHEVALGAVFAGKQGSL
jgi:hypothetical protein